MVFQARSQAWFWTLLPGHISGRFTKPRKKGMPKIHTSPSCVCMSISLRWFTKTSAVMRGEHCLFILGKNRGLYIFVFNTYIYPYRGLTWQMKSTAMKINYPLLSCYDLNLKDPDLNQQMWIDRVMMGTPQESNMAVAMQNWRLIFLIANKKQLSWISTVSMDVDGDVP